MKFGVKPHFVPFFFPVTNPIEAYIFCSKNFFGVPAENNFKIFQQIVHFSSRRYPDRYSNPPPPFTPHRDLTNMARCVRVVNELHAAILRKNEDRARALILRGDININQRDSDGGTPLIYAACSDFPLLVEMLLERGADLRSVTNSGSNALHFCATHGGISSTTLLLKAGASIETRSVNGARPLHMAAQGGHFGVTELLLSAGANIDARRSDGATPMFEAALHGRERVFGRLLREGANFALTCKGVSPLAVAIQEEKCSVLREFQDVVGFHTLLDGHTLLQHAACFKNTEMLSIIMDGGVVDFKGNALCRAVSSGLEESVKLLLHRSCENIEGVTAQGVVKIYVNCAEDVSGVPLLDCSFKSSCLKPRILRRIVDAGVDTDQWFGVAVNEITGEGYSVRLTAMIHAILRVPAVRAISWTWPDTKTAKTAKTAKTIVTKPLKPRPRMVFAAFFRKKDDESFQGYDEEDV